MVRRVILALTAGLFALFAGCGEKKKSGNDDSANNDSGRNGHTVRDTVIEQPEMLDERGAASGDEAAVDPISVDVEDLPPLPEVVTKGFIMGLWAKPHDGRGMIEEFADGGIQEGV